ncbi:MAG: hypothetical protein GY820_44650 [Gammaproteobacteria bacterium]|nr:hypothetical protein [Gammaproteobacteria bacterium]
MRQKNSSDINRINNLLDSGSLEDKKELDALLNHLFPKDEEKNIRDNIVNEFFVNQEIKSLSKNSSIVDKIEELTGEAVDKDKIRLGSVGFLLNKLSEFGITRPNKKSVDFLKENYAFMQPIIVLLENNCLNYLKSRSWFYDRFYVGMLAAKGMRDLVNNEGLRNAIINLSNDSYAYSSIKNDEESIE